MIRSPQTRNPKNNWVNKCNVTEALIREVYKRQNPAKVGEVSALLAKYAGAECLGLATANG